MDPSFVKINLEHCRIASAKYGGPIALMKNKNHIYLMSEDDIKDNVCFYSNSGVLLNTCLFQEEGKIVCFDFIEDEMLLIVLENGLYFLIDPNKSTNYKK